MRSNMERATITWPAHLKWMALTLNWWLRVSALVFLIGVGLFVAGFRPVVAVVAFLSLIVCILSSIYLIKKFQVNP